MLHAVAVFFAAQPVLAGFAGVTLTGGLMFVLRAAPKALWANLKTIFSVTLVIEEREEAFLFLSTWLSRHRAVQRARTLMLAQSYDYREQRWQWQITLGRGWHVLRYAGAWLFIHREMKDGGELAQALGTGRNQRFWVISLGRSQVAIRGLIEEAKANYYGDGMVNIHVFDQGWVRADCRAPRPLQTVFMPADQKQRLVGDLGRFLASREVYRRRGVPWRRGYLLKGPPGTGKTTMIFALAGLHGRPIYVLNLNSLTGDNQLLGAFNGIERDGVVVIEDIDTLRASRDRAEPTAPKAKALVNQINIEEPKGVTLSGLLNAIDGLAAREGRVLFITSNHAEKLDPALLRPGRIDLTEEIGPLERCDALEMVEAFGAQPAILVGIALPVPAAKLQGVLLAAEPEGKLIAFPQPAPPRDSHGVLRKGI